MIKRLVQFFAILTITSISAFIYPFSVEKRRTKIVITEKDREGEYSALNLNASAASGSMMIKFAEHRTKLRQHALARFAENIGEPMDPKDVILFEAILSTNDQRNLNIPKLMEKYPKVVTTQLFP